MKLATSLVSTSLLALSASAAIVPLTGRLPTSTLARAANGIRGSVTGTPARSTHAHTKTSNHATGKPTTPAKKMTKTKGHRFVKETSGRKKHHKTTSSRPASASKETAGTFSTKPLVGSHEDSSIASSEGAEPRPLVQPPVKVQSPVKAAAGQTGRGADSPPSVRAGAAGLAAMARVDTEEPLLNLPASLKVGGINKRDDDDAGTLHLEAEAALEARAAQRKHHKHPLLPKLNLPPALARTRIGISLPPVVPHSGKGKKLNTRAQNVANPRPWRRDDQTTTVAGTLGFVEVATPLNSSTVNVAKTVAGLVYSANPARNGSGYDLGTSDTQSTQFYLFPVTASGGESAYELRVPIVDSNTFVTVDHCATFAVGKRSALSLEQCGDMPGDSQMFAYDAKSGQIQPVYEADADAAAAPSTSVPSPAAFVAMPNEDLSSASADPNAAQFTPAPLQAVAETVTPTVSASAALPTASVQSLVADANSTILAAVNGSMLMANSTADAPNMLASLNGTATWSLLAANSTQSFLSNATQAQSLLGEATVPTNAEDATADIVLFFVPATNQANVESSSPSSTDSVSAAAATPSALVAAVVSADPASASASPTIQMKAALASFEASASIASSATNVLTALATSSPLSVSPTALPTGVVAAAVATPAPSASVSLAGTVPAPMQEVYVNGLSADPSASAAC